MTVAQLAEYRTTRASCLDRLRTRVPVVEMGAAKFCQFEDIFAFPQKLSLQRRA
jgi:hypothetical protein